MIIDFSALQPVEVAMPIIHPPTAMDTLIEITSHICDFSKILINEYNALIVNGRVVTTDYKRKIVCFPQKASTFVALKGLKRRGISTSETDHFAFSEGLIFQGDDRNQNLKELLAFLETHNEGYDLIQRLHQSQTVKGNILLKGGYFLDGEKVARVMKETVHFPMEYIKDELFDAREFVESL